MALFEKTFEVRWADVDPNMHMRQTAYGDYADQVRVAYFEEEGFSFLNFRALNIGPVLFKSTSTFLREVHLGEQIRIDCRATYLSEDYRKWAIQHQVFNAKNELACVIDLEGAWLDLKARKVAIPPAPIQAVMDKILDLSTTAL